MEARLKAAELVEKYKEYVHGYVGSSILTNTEYPDQILSQAKKAALIAVEEVISELAYINNNESFNVSEYGNYWQEVKAEIEKL